MKCNSPRFIDSPLCWSPLVHIKNRTGERPTYAFDILGTASNAVNDDQGNYIPETYATKSEVKKSGVSEEEVRAIIAEELVAINRQISEINERLTTIDDTISSIETRLDSVNIQLTSLDNRVTALEG